MEKINNFTTTLPLPISKLATALVFAATCMSAFFVPFSVGHPQWLVGTIVNICLFLGVIYLPKRYFIPLAILPSLGVLSRGLVFGPFTYFLIYFLPFIWLGNFILMLAFSSLIRANKRWNNSIELSYVVSVVLSSVAKFLFLFIAASFYFKFHFVPAVFLQSMGLNQLATALSGGLISFILWKIYQQRQKN